MRTPGFLGLPEKVQTIVIEGLDEEIEDAKLHVEDAEQAHPVDADLLQALRKDISRTETLRTRLVNGQA